MASVHSRINAFLQRTQKLSSTSSLQQSKHQNLTKNIPPRVSAVTPQKITRVQPHFDSPRQGYTQQLNRASSVQTYRASKKFQVSPAKKKPENFFNALTRSIQNQSESNHSHYKQWEAFLKIDSTALQAAIQFVKTESQKSMYSFEQKTGKLEQIVKKESLGMEKMLNKLLQENFRLKEALEPPVDSSEVQGFIQKEMKDLKNTMNQMFVEALSRRQIEQSGYGKNLQEVVGGYFQQASQVNVKELVPILCQRLKKEQRLRFDAEMKIAQTIQLRQLEINELEDKVARLSNQW